MKKHLQRFLGLFLIILSLGVFVSAQENQTDQKAINGGVLNGRATQLVRPTYPAAARAVNASGAVNVQVTIDEEGNVIEALAVNGHPLLRFTAVEAAKASKFSPTLLSGQPVKVMGIIVYNFLTEMPLSQIGFAIGTASAGNTANFPADTIRFSLPNDWTDARQIIGLIIKKQSFDRYEQSKAKFAAERQNTEAAKTSKVIKTGKEVKIDEVRKGVVFVQGERAALAEAKESEEVKESYESLFNSLSEAIKDHLSGNEAIKWNFALAVAGGRTKAQLEDDAKLRQNLADLKLFISNTPAGVSSVLVAELQKIAALDGDNELDAADKTKIEAFVNRLR